MIRFIGTLYAHYIYWRETAEVRTEKAPVETIQQIERWIGYTNRMSGNVAFPLRELFKIQTKVSKHRYVNIPVYLAAIPLLITLEWEITFLKQATKVICQKGWRTIEVPLHNLEIKVTEKLSGDLRIRGGEHMELSTLKGYLSSYRY